MSLDQKTTLVFWSAWSGWGSWYGVTERQQMVAQVMTESTIYGSFRRHRRSQAVHHQNAFGFSEFPRIAIPPKANRSAQASFSSGFLGAACGDRSMIPGTTT